MVCDAFQHGSHLRDGDDEAEVASSRLPQCNDVYALAIDLDLEPIDFVVVIEHIPRDVAIAFAQ